MASTRSRTGPLAWSLVACPILGLAVGLAAARYAGGTVSLVAFIAMPVVLSVGGLLAMGRSAAETITLSPISAAEAGLVLLVLFLLLANIGVYDT